MAILATALVLTGCNAKPEQEIIEDVVVEQTQTISPLPVTIDMNQLDNCTVAVSFEEGDAYVDDNGAMQLDVTVYACDLFDMVDMISLPMKTAFTMKHYLTMQKLTIH